MQVKKSKMSPAEKKELEQLRIENAKYKSQLDYIAMMTDVELEDEEAEDEQEV